MPRNRLKNNDVALFLPLIFLIQLIYNRSQVAPELVNKARELNKNYRLQCKTESVFPGGPGSRPRRSLIII
jgi:hypothetical protein